MMARAAKFIVVLAAAAAVFGISLYVTLTVLIKSGDTVVVPDLVGRATVQVLETLSALKLNIKVEGSEFNDTIPKNHVLRQAPDPGMEIKSGRSVRVTISKGPATVSAPNLAGLSSPQARLILEDNGLCQGRQSRMFDPGVEKDRIVAQTPAAGTPLAHGSCVDLLVSLGPRPNAYAAPDLIGQPMASAIGIIEHRGLTLGEITAADRKDRDPNRVVDQRPKAGSRLSEGTAVHLAVNRAPGKSNGKWVANSGFIRHRIKDGFLKKRIRIRMDGYGIADDLYDMYVKPGEEIWLLMPTAGTAEIKVYEDEELVVKRTMD